MSGWLELHETVCFQLTTPNLLHIPKIPAKKRLVRPDREQAWPYMSYFLWKVMGVAVLPPFMAALVESHGCRRSWPMGVAVHATFNSDDLLF